MSDGLFDDLPPAALPEVEPLLAEAVDREHPELLRRLEEGEELTDEARTAIIATARAALRRWDGPRAGAQEV